MQCTAVCIADVRNITHSVAWPASAGSSSAVWDVPASEAYFFGLFCFGFLASRLPLSFFPMTPPSAAIVVSQERNCVLLKSLVVAASWPPNTLFPRSWSSRLANAAFNASSCFGVTLMGRPSKSRSRSTGMSERKER